jgi:hypothetical protein
MLERLLHGFGYLVAPVLFFRAGTPEEVVGRLRLAYRLVGVNIQDTATVDGTERTEFRCPYRNLGASRYGEKWVCHQKLDRVDDGYVTFLERHKDLDYERPRDCAESGDCDPDCCYSEVSELA